MSIKPMYYFIIFNVIIFTSNWWKSDNSQTFKWLYPYAADGKFDPHKMMHKPEILIGTFEDGYSSERTHRELSNEYQHYRF